MTLVDDEFHLGPIGVCSVRRVDMWLAPCEPLVALPSSSPARMNNTVPQLSNGLKRSLTKRFRHTTRDEPRCRHRWCDALDCAENQPAAIVLVDGIKIQMRIFKDVQASRVLRLSLWS